MIIVIVVASIVLWMAYEIWSAPLMEEDDFGNLRTKRPARKLSDLFKRK
jgi:hypothetical protein